VSANVTSPQRTTCLVAVEAYTDIAAGGAIVNTYLLVNGAPAARTPDQNRTAGRSIHRLGAGPSVHRSPARRDASLPRSWPTGRCQIVSAGAGLAGSGGMARCVFHVRAGVERWDCLWFEPARTTGRPIYSRAIELWSRPGPCGCAGIANSSSEASPRGS
jgi:hypothetical protein